MNNNAVVTKDTMSFNMFMSNDAVKRKVEEVIGGKKGQQFITSIVSSVQNNEQLKECANTSIFNAALIGAALDLSPSPQLGQFYMVPFKNTKKNCKEAQFQLGYKGYQQLAIRSGQLKKLNVLAIKDGELIKYDPLNEEIEVNLIDDEVERENAKTIGYYAMFELVNGFRKTMYWSREKMLKHADKYSQSFSIVGYNKLINGEIAEKDMWKYSSFWYKDFDGMAFKTMLRQLISKGGCPMSIEMQKAYECDMAVIKDDGTKEYVDNIETNSIIIEQTENDTENSVETKQMSLNEI